MHRGRVYLWTPDPNRAVGGAVKATVVPLRLESEAGIESTLRGRFAVVCNAGTINCPDPHAGGTRSVALGSAAPDRNGNFLFEPGRGGGRLDKVVLANPDVRWRYVQAARFGEVNTYFHVDRIAVYIDGLLQQLGAPSLPPVVAVVTAHPATTEQDGVRDGVRRPSGRWFPLQGGHYRLPSRRNRVAEHRPLSPQGEIHLGPGWMLLEHGALVEAAGGRYRANASHNAGIIYHEYGHHIARHTADFAANTLRQPDRQRNAKSAIEEGTCDYWVATLLGIPHIWAWHRRNDAEFPHRRCLTARKTMQDYDASPSADPHANGTIWAAALWDLRATLSRTDPDGVRITDLLLVKALLQLGTLSPRIHDPGPRGLARLRSTLAAGLSALLDADEILTGGGHRRLILRVFEARGIEPDAGLQKTRGLLKHVSRDEIPDDADLHTATSLEAALRVRAEPDLSLIAVGDIMLDGRARGVIAARDMDYPFAATLPLLLRSPIVIGNLEGPFARLAQREDRNHSYQVDPVLANALRNAGINVVTLANNHLLDCGRAGVLETLEALERAGVAAVGAGADTRAAHRAVIRKAGRWSVGMLAYYWNRRCAAISRLPGSAMDPPDALAADILRLRGQVDRVVVSFHWGVPYERQPSSEDRAKARWAVDCGADVVIGHHPHIIQPLEIYRDRPILYSLGNFAFGSGNSRAEGLLAAIRFEENQTLVEAYPLYVKNRDPRVNYQPKVLRGRGGERTLRHLVDISELDPELLELQEGRIRLSLPHTGCEAMSG